MPLARISLTLSCHFSLSFIASGRSSWLHPVSSHSCCMYVRAGRPALARPYVGVHRSTSLMSSSLLLKQCPACLVRLTWMVFVMGGRWPYSWCLVGCCCQDLYSILPSRDFPWHYTLSQVFVSSFNGKSTFNGYLIPKSSFLKKISNIIKRRAKEVNTFPSDISLNVNLKSRREFELVYFEDVVQHFNHYTTETRIGTIFLIRIYFYDVIVWVSFAYISMMLHFLVIWYHKTKSIFIHIKSIFIHINSSISNNSV